FKGKFIFINPGINTLPIAMARPMKSVPINRKPIPVKERIVMPMISKINDKAIVHSIPIRFAIFGANGENNAKASNGNVVIDPASALLMPKSSRIKEISAPTEVNGTLKLAATNITRSEERRGGKERRYHWIN